MSTRSELTDEEFVEVLRKFLTVEPDVQPKPPVFRNNGVINREKTLGLACYAGLEE